MVDPAIPQDHPGVKKATLSVDYSAANLMVVLHLASFPGGGVAWERGYFIPCRDS